MSAKGIVERRRLYKRLVVAGIVLVSFVIVAIVGGGFYYSSILRSDALTPKAPKATVYDLEVLSLKEGQITVTRTEDSEKDGVWGLEWEGGYGQVASIVEMSRTRVTRGFGQITGTPLEQGDRARTRDFAFPEDPAAVLGRSVDEVEFSSDIGALRGWFVPGTSDTWAIFVHGKGAPRTETLRLLRTTARLGYPGLVIDYRNDPGAPRSSDGFYRFGQTEWKDLEAAVAYAKDHGAKDAVVVGYSMGGGIALNFLYQSRLATTVRGLILDSPMIDFGETVNLEARNRGIPSFITAVAKKISSSRFDIDWDQWNYLSSSDRIAVPVLIFHGKKDPSVPVSTSRALAERRRDIVTLVEVPEGGHVESWNVDPRRYESAVAEFLNKISAG